jgi:hypothetical protein
MPKLFVCNVEPESGYSVQFIVIADTLESAKDIITQDLDDKGWIDNDWAQRDMMDEGAFGWTFTEYSLAIGLKHWEENA